MMRICLWPVESGLGAEERRLESINLSPEGAIYCSGKSFFLLFPLVFHGRTVQLFGTPFIHPVPHYYPGGFAVHQSHPRD